QRVDQAHDMGVFVNPQPPLALVRIARGDLALDDARTVQYPRLHCLLQLRECAHAASASTVSATLRARSSSATRSASAGMLSSRSIIVATGPRRRTACA